MAVLTMKTSSPVSWLTLLITLSVLTVVLSLRFFFVLLIMTVNMPLLFPVMYSSSLTDRVVPSHSFKFISALQYSLGDQQYQKQPLLIRIESKVRLGRTLYTRTALTFKQAGHGAGKPTSKIITEYADQYAFIGKVLNATWNSAC